MKPYRDFFKRAIDIVASGGGLLVLAVPLAAVTVWLHFAPALSSFRSVRAKAEKSLKSSSSSQ